MPSAVSTIAPGSRVVIRGEEWLVRRSDLGPAGDQVLTVSGLSPLVRNRYIPVMLRDIDSNPRALQANFHRAILPCVCELAQARLRRLFGLNDRRPAGDPATFRPSRPRMGRSAGRPPPARCPGCRRSRHGRRGESDNPRAAPTARIPPSIRCRRGCRP